MYPSGPYLKNKDESCSELLSEGLMNLSKSENVP